MLPLKLREIVKQDLNFIYSTWLNHFKNHSPQGRKIRTSVFFENHQKLIDRIMESNKARCLVVTPIDDDEVILGYLIYEQVDIANIVHFVFVKEPFRKLGIAKRLFEHAEMKPDFVFTHWTYDLVDILKKYSNLTYNPYRL